MSIKITALFRNKSEKAPYKVSVTLFEKIFINLLIGKSNTGELYIIKPQEVYKNKDNEEVKKDYYFFKKEFSNEIIAAIEDYLLEEEPTNNNKNKKEEEEEFNDDEFPF